MATKKRTKAQTVITPEPEPAPVSVAPSASEEINGHKKNGLDALSKFLIGNEDLNILVGRREQLTIPVGRPDKQIYFRVCPQPEYSTMVLLFEDRIDSGFYLVDKTVAHKFTTGLFPTYLFTVIDKTGTLRLWPVKVPGADGRTPNSWHTSELQAAHIAMQSWIKLESDRAAGGWAVHHPLGDLGGVSWPTRPFLEIVSTGFIGRKIEAEDHPIIRRLEGLE
jgi:hypothetical protein